MSDSAAPSPSVPQIGWAKRAFRLISMICAYALIMLVLAEVGLRILGYKPQKISARQHTISTPDDKLGWINIPGTYLSPEAGHAPMTFLDDHSRRSWTTPVKPDQHHEVLLVGCSFTQGFGVEDQDTFAYLLNARYPHVMFHNFGTGGYGTYQSLLRIKQNLAQPDANAIPLVIYGFIDLHLQRNVAVANWVRSLSSTRDQYVVPPHVRMGKDGLQYYGPDTIPFWPLESHSALVTLLANAYLELRLRRHGSQLNAATALIDQMNQAVIDAHKRFLIVLLNRPPNGLVPFLQTHKIDYANCDNPAYDKSPSEFRLGGVGHPNAAQNALWAACIGNWIDHEMPTLAAH